MKTLVDLRKFMNDRLNLSELQLLCFELNIDFENLAGEIKNDKIIETIKYAHRHQKLAELINWLANSYNNLPDVNWSEARHLIATLQQYDIAEASFEGESRLPAPFQAPPPLPYFVKRREYSDLLQTIEKKPNGIVRSTGLIGTGKTAIANQAANKLRDKFPDGVIWLNGDLEKLEKDLKQTAVDFGQLDSFNQQTELHNKIEFIRRILAPKQALVVFDNVYEADKINYFFQDNGNFFTIITTRDQFLFKNLAPEEIAVSTFTEEETQDYLIHILGEDRVTAESQAVRQLHLLLGGLPLALDFVSGTLNESIELTIGEYNALLADESTRIEGLNDWNSGTNNISAAFELSYQGLPRPLQNLFNSLASFRGLSFTSQAVASINKTSIAYVKIGLGRMVRLSILQYDQNKGRYCINPLVHSFASQKCGRNLEEFQKRGVIYYLDILATNKNSEYENFLEQEWANLLGVFDVLYNQEEWLTFCENILHLTQFEIGTMGLLEKRGYWEDARRLLDQAIRASENLSDLKLTVMLHLNASGFALLQNNREVAQYHLNEIELQIPHFTGDSTFLWSLVQWHDLRSRIFLREDPSRALDELTTCLDELKRTHANISLAHRGYIHSRLLSLYGPQGRLVEAENAAVRAIELLPQIPTPALINVYNGFNIIYRLQGKLKESIETGQKALELAEAINAIHRLPSLWNNLGLNQQIAGQFSKAITNFTRAQSLAQRLGNQYIDCGCGLSLGETYLMLGDDMLAKQMLEEALMIARAEEFEDIEGLILSKLVDLYVLSGNPEAGKIDLVNGLEIAKKLNMGYLFPTLYRQQAQIASLENNYDGALSQIEQAINMSKDGQDKLEEGISYRVKGEILSNHGDLKGGEQAYHKSETILRNLNEYEYAHTLLSKANYLAKDNESTSTFLPKLQQAISIFEKLKAKREIAKVNSIISQM